MSIVVKGTTTHIQAVVVNRVLIFITCNYNTTRIVMNVLFSKKKLQSLA